MNEWLHAPLLGSIAFPLALWIVPAIVFSLVARASLRALVAPLAAEAPPSDAEGFSFSAVAVTPEARAAVGALLTVTAFAAALIVALPAQALVGSEFLAALGVYVAAVVGAAAAFQRASRIAVGFDGVLVTGTSRTRFFAYRDLDGVETTRSGDVLLRRNGRVALRLQLHGKDADRHEAIAARLRDSLNQARRQAGGGAQRLAEAASSAELARAARGDGDYRAAGATREELWELVEAPAIPGVARAAAAEALAPRSSMTDRARLRIAAERCAEPAAREALLRFASSDEIVEDEENEREPSPPLRRHAGRRTTHEA